MIDCIENNESSLPFLFVVMGVSGSGKSTIAYQLAKLNSFHFLEADDYHSESAKQKMQNGEALNDDDRKPWIDSMCVILKMLAKSNTHCCLAYSGLRREHRQRFRCLGFHVIFIHLSGTIQQLQNNLEQRESHFFESSLLDSQLDAMQLPENEPDILTLNIMEGIDDMVMLAQAIVLENMQIS